MSTETDSILSGVENILAGIVREGGAYQLEEITKQLTICSLHYHTWEESYKLEASSAKYAYNNLPTKIREMDARVKWYFKLLQAYVAQRTVTTQRTAV